MPISRFTVAAVREVASKTEAQLERDTALTWAARAEANFKTAMATGCNDRLRRAQRHADEALEHAAFAEDNGRLVGALAKRLRSIQQTPCVT